MGGGCRLLVKGYWTNGIVVLVLLAAIAVLVPHWHAVSQETSTIDQCRTSAPGNDNEVDTTFSSCVQHILNPLFASFGMTLTASVTDGGKSRGDNSIQMQNVEGLVEEGEASGLLQRDDT